MANNEEPFLELSPNFKERLIRSLIAIIGYIVGTIIICGVIIVDIQNTMAQFIGIFVGSLTVAISLWRILRIATQKLYIDTEEICYRDRFQWERISWSEVISIGRANDFETKENDDVLKKIKSLILLTNNGIKKFDMSSYSLNHGIETINKIANFRLKESLEESEDE